MRPRNLRTTSQSSLQVGGSAHPHEIDLVVSSRPRRGRSTRSRTRQEGLKPRAVPGGLHQDGGFSPHKVRKTLMNARRRPTPSSGETAGERRL